jgi:hypothetical protein
VQKYKSKFNFLNHSQCLYQTLLSVCLTLSNFLLSCNPILLIMILVADSGSTKCDWIFTDGDQTTLTFHTMGFNPFFHPADLIESEIRKNKG